MKQRLEGLLAKLNKTALLRHAELIKGQEISMSEPFSAGQYWICFEMIARFNTWYFSCHIAFDLLLQYIYLSMPSVHIETSSQTSPIRQAILTTEDTR